MHSEIALLKLFVAQSNYTIGFLQVLNPNQGVPKSGPLPNYQKIVDLLNHITTCLWN